ncbi:uncharacterized protein N7496_008105 [Penicillium cataractarum]|uniref:Uncharacterized protein n=1 Tax=Penicillium cataractarum TaxID=2100454 RepID=A0A9W9RY02_9EURO|nr:uncharacterized protein N7496_008105 [Penicillium cataractarum]KAJ5368345.1 hypothetical protein N7496_008105 [Penicillium cataractarum]
MRIADEEQELARRIWLQDLANTLPDDCQLDGFDLSESMFKDIIIPSNVSFYQHNLLEPFPTEFLGQYDVVNARALVVALSHDEWEPALRNLIFSVPGATNGHVPANAERLSAVLEGIQNFMIAALKIRKFDSIDSVDQVMEMRMAAEKDLLISAAGSVTRFMWW